MTDSRATQYPSGRGAMVSSSRGRLWGALVLSSTVFLAACGGGGGGGGGGSPVSDPAPVQQLPTWDDQPCDDAVEQNGYDTVMARWREQTDTVPYEPGRTVFTGSSSIRFWDSLQLDMRDWAPIHRGFGGAVLWDVVEYIDELILRHDPRAVVLFAGANDIALGDTPEQVATAYRCVVEKIAQGLGDDVSIHFLSITPTPLRWSFWDQSSAANEQVRAITEDWPGLHFVDTTGEFLATGEPPDASLFLADGLHLSVEGYAIWREVLQAHLDRTLPRYGYQAEVLAPGTRMLVDFGPSESADGGPTVSPDAFGQNWNNFDPTDRDFLMHAGEHVGELVDVTGQPTTVRLVAAASNHFALGILDGGLQDPEEDKLGNLAVASATQDYIFTQESGTVVGRRGALTLEGLDPDARYSLRLFASVSGSDVGSVRYQVTDGGGVQSIDLDVGGGLSQIATGAPGNEDQTADFTDLQADATGRLHIGFEPTNVFPGARAQLALMEFQIQ